MRILHTEASPGWGGQELRILREAEGMRERGHEVILAIQEGGGLVAPACEAGFTVYEMPFTKKRLVPTFWKLLCICRKHKIELINTHSSLDAWLGGIVARLTRRKVVRTRHLSTAVRPGLNARLLYNTLADAVVTTCAEAADTIREQAKLPPPRCLSIPTGVNPDVIQTSVEKGRAFREKWGIADDEIVAGTLCVLRGWKGVADLLHAAKLLENEPKLKWLVVGSGSSEDYFRSIWKELGLEERVIFTGHQTPPYDALSAFDIFVLLSWANEGVSQASLQAAWLEKPLVTTATGGLGEVCLPEKTGLRVHPHQPKEVAEAVKRLVDAPNLRHTFGKNAHTLVQEHFLLDQTLVGMERVYNAI